MDTQLSRFQVFIQEKPGSPFQDVGSVHAADVELALLNARDVFARRPECSAMWVVPVEAIYSKTAEELAGEEMSHNGDPPVEMRHPSKPVMYHVFCKAQSAGTQTWVGSVQAGSPQEALQRGIEQFSSKPEPFAWWVLPASAVYATREAEAPSFFEPARNKTFRLSSDFRTVSAMRKIRRKGAGQTEGKNGS